MEALALKCAAARSALMVTMQVNLALAVDRTSRCAATLLSNRLADLSCICDPQLQPWQSAMIVDLPRIYGWTILVTMTRLVGCCVAPLFILLLHIDLRQNNHRSMTAVLTPESAKETVD